MIFKLTNISVLLFTITLINLFTTLISWQRKKSKEGQYFAWGMLALTLWTLASALDYAAVPIPLKVSFAKFEYLTYNSSLAFFVIFSISYAGFGEWLKSKWVMALLWLVPISNALLAFTNELHGWIWRGFAVSEYGDNVIIYEHGPGFIWEALTGYLAIGLIITLLWSASRRGPNFSRRQAQLLFIASVIPVLGNVLYLLDIKGVRGIDWSSVTFSISGLLFLMALYGTRLLDLVPVARHEMIEKMTDSVLVLDPDNTVMDLNPAAEKNFGINLSQLGQPINIIFAAWPELVELCSSLSENTSNIIVAHKNEPKVFDIHLTILNDQRGQSYGKLIIFRDITERFQAERTLEQRLFEIQALHENLQQTQAQVVEQQRTLARLEERQSMARDLHDSVNQSINSLVLFSETMVSTLEKNNPERARQIATRILESARQALKETRLLLYEIRPPGRESGLDLVRDLETRLETVERHSGVKAQIIQNGSLDYCPQEWLDDLFWIAIEALNNSVKHAQARNVQIIIKCASGRLELDILDDGVGFDATHTSNGGMGLRNMRERAGLLGGDLNIDSTPGKGTSIRFTAAIK